jgi:hypothetical protein
MTLSVLKINHISGNLLELKITKDYLMGSVHQKPSDRTKGAGEETKKIDIQGQDPKRFVGGVTISNQCQ